MYFTITQTVSRLGRLPILVLFNQQMSLSAMEEAVLLDSRF